MTHLTSCSRNYGNQKHQKFTKNGKKPNFVSSSECSSTVASSASTDKVWSKSASDSSMEGSSNPREIEHSGRKGIFPEKKVFACFADLCDNLSVNEVVHLLEIFFLLNFSVFLGNYIFIKSVLFVFRPVHLHRGIRVVYHRNLRKLVREQITVKKVQQK